MTRENLDQLIEKCGDIRRLIVRQERLCDSGKYDQLEKLDRMIEEHERSIQIDFDSDFDLIDRFIDWLQSSKDKLIDEEEGIAGYEKEIWEEFLNEEDQISMTWENMFPEGDEDD